MARKKSKFTVQDFNNYMRREEVAVEPPSIAETGGLSGFWAEIKKQGEQLRAKPAVIPRNHIWEDDGSIPNLDKKKKSRKGRK